MAALPKFPDKFTICFSTFEPPTPPTPLPALARLHTVDSARVHRGVARRERGAAVSHVHSTRGVLHGPRNMQTFRE